MGRAITELQGGIFYGTRNEELEFGIFFFFPDEKELIELMFYSGIW